MLLTNRLFCGRIPLVKFGRTVLPKIRRASYTPGSFIRLSRACSSVGSPKDILTHPTKISSPTSFHDAADTPIKSARQTSPKFHTFDKGL